MNPRSKARRERRAREQGALAEIAPLADKIAHMKNVRANAKAVRDEIEQSRNRTLRNCLNYAENPIGTHDAMLARDKDNDRARYNPKVIEAWLQKIFGGQPINSILVHRMVTEARARYGEDIKVHIGQESGTLTVEIL